MIFQTVKDKSEPILFADGTSIIFTNSDLTDFIRDIRILFEHLNKRFTANSISLNVDNTHLIQPTTKMDSKVTSNVSYAKKIISKDTQNSLDYIQAIDCLGKYMFCRYYIH
jgi:hypothetical protein